MSTDMNLVVKTLQEMKKLYEDAIVSGDYTGLIRSKKLIEILHEFAIRELIARKRVPSQWIYRDKPVYGYPKTKTQDILIQPPQNARRNLSVGPLMTINVRSQLSSIGKNYDTLFERLFAEALNLHNRFPYLALGYIYLLPKIGYDDKAAKDRRIAFVERYDLEKYVISFLSIANRENPKDVPWKYEKVCLLIVDFEKDPPRVMDNMKVFVEEGLVRPDFGNLFSFEDLSIRNFFDELHKIMLERYYLLGFRGQ